MKKLFLLASQELGTQNGTIDAAHDILEEGDGTFYGYDSYPENLPGRKVAESRIA